MFTKNRYFYLFIILSAALFVRMYHLNLMGFRFADEGYHLNHARLLLESPGTPSLYFKHGLIYFLYLGLHLFSFSVSGSLLFSVFCGILTCLFFYFISKRFLSTKLSILLLIVFSFNYYIFYYQRSNMSDGYALMFFCITLYFFIQALKEFGFLKNKSEKENNIKHSGYYPYIYLIISGLLLGYSFTVRIQTCLTMLGAAGAFGLSLFFMRKKYNFKSNDLLRYFYFFAVWVFAGLAGYLIFMFYIKENVIWDSTFEWYSKNRKITEKPFFEWKCYIIQHLWHLCSLPFLLIALAGIFFDVKNFKKLNLIKLWLLICFAGLFAAYLKMAMPWPRAYLYFIVILIFYWLNGAFCISGLFKPKYRQLILLLCLIVTLIGESALILPFVNKQSGYNTALQIVKSEKKGTIIGTHSWPIFESAEFKHDNIIIYKLCRRYNSLTEFNWILKDIQKHYNEVFIITDNNVSFMAPDTVPLLLEYYTNNPQFLILNNDFGEDYHTCMDAFGRKPVHDFFSDKIIISHLQD
jgi:4-amino-4-deoxy-L-arabinose transferase-like glycosyltransferase